MLPNSKLVVCDTAESQTLLLIEIKPDTCDFCGCCVGVCPEDAIELKEASIAIIETRCTNCAKCVWVCPFEALVFNREKIKREQPV